MTTETEGKGRASSRRGNRWRCCCCVQSRKWRLWTLVMAIIAAFTWVYLARLVRDPGGPYGFSSATTGEDVMAALSPGFMRHMCFVVTGATSGIGYETAKLLAAHDMQVILVGRSKESAERARLKMIREMTGGFRDEEHVAEELQKSRELFDERCGPSVPTEDKVVRRCVEWKKRIAMLVSDPYGEHYLPHLTTDNHPPLIRAYGCDFGNLSDVQRFVRRDLDIYRSKFKFRINGLILNAGVLTPEQRQTVDGHELHMGVNHVGHALLVNLLMQKLIVDGPWARVVFVSSWTARYGDERFLESDSLTLPADEPYSGPLAYGNSKLAQILYARELHERYHRHNVTVAAVDPGSIITKIQRDIVPWALSSNRVVQFFRWLIESTVLKNVEQGAATQIYAVAAPDLHRFSGRYWANCHEASSGRDDLVANATARRLLWQRTDALFGNHGVPWYDPDQDPEPLPNHWAPYASGYLKAVIENEGGVYNGK